MFRKLAVTLLMAAALVVGAFAQDDQGEGGQGGDEAAASGGRGKIGIRAGVHLVFITTHVVF